MKKITAALMFVIFANMAFGLTNSVLVDFNIFGNPDSLKYEGDTETTARQLGDYYTDNWIVFLNSSSQTVQNRALSYVTNSDSKGNGGAWQPEKVIGVRAHFPISAWASYALVKPPYPFEIYGGDNGDKFLNGKGVAHNVGTIKSISSWVYGRNFLVMYYINLADENEKLTSYPMGYVYFNGWRELKWNNNNYVTDARDRVLKRTPLYSKLIPSIKLDSMQFSRTKDTVGGDFITYVRNITVEYEQSSFETEEDIDDEAIWQIIKTEYNRRSVIENKRIEEIVELQDLEKRRLQPVANDATN